MQAEAVIFFIVIAILASIWGDILDLKEKFLPIQASVSQTQVQEIPQEKKPVSPKVTAPKPAKPVTKPQKEEPLPQPTVSVNTYIKFGPRNGEVIEETNRVTFEFGAEVFPEETEGQRAFETKVEGLDEDWEKTRRSERTIELPAGPKEYTFLVRAKIDDIVDPTPAERTFKLNISSYFGKVEISNIKPPDVHANPSLITLSTKLGKNEEINITGWEIEGKNGKFNIPQGIEEFNPLITNIPSKDIIIKYRDKIYISSDSNPLGPKGLNFRPNKCMGYLTSSRNFTIPISKNCPRPESEKLPSYLEPCCREYVLSLKTCESPKYQGMKEYNLFEDSNCMYYITFNFSYAGCFANYFQKENFSENEWHIYLDRKEREIMDEEVDTIYLRDQNGLLIDKYSYGKVCCKSY